MVSDRQLVPSAGNHRVQAQNFTRLRDSDHQGLALTRGGRELGASLAEDKNAARTLSFDRNHRMFRENRGMFYLVERSMDSWERSQEKLRERRWQSRQLSTQFNPDTLIGAPPSPTKTRLRRFWRETIDQPQIFKSRISSDCPLRKMMTEGWHAGCRSIFGLKLNACSIHPVRSGQD
jgi:hypothetical protein